MTTAVVVATTTATKGIAHIASPTCPVPHVNPACAMGSPNAIAAPSTIAGAAPTAPTSTTAGACSRSALRIIGSAERANSGVSALQATTTIPRSPGAAITAATIIAASAATPTITEAARPRRMRTAGAIGDIR